MAPRLRILGCGEAFDSGPGNNSCVLYDGREGRVARAPGVPTVVFDCGYQVPERLWELPQLYPRVDGLCLTHLHADHAFGIVPLLARYWEEGRTRAFRILGPRGTETYVRKLLELGYPGMLAKLRFGLEFVTLREGDSLRWGELEFRCARSEHSVLNLAVRVEGSAPRSGRFSFAVSGDGRPTAATRALFEGVEWLLHETYSRDPLYETHGDLKTLSKFAAGSAIKHLAITHISRHEKSRVRSFLSQLSRREPGRWRELSPCMEIVLGKGSR